jgi:hypothetical protein
MTDMSAQALAVSISNGGYLRRYALGLHFL